MFWDFGYLDFFEFECFVVFFVGDDLDVKVCVVGFICDIGFGFVDVGGFVFGGELLEFGLVFYKCEIMVEEV